jgi:hypothetical protein
VTLIRNIDPFRPLPSVYEKLSDATAGGTPGCRRFFSGIFVPTPRELVRRLADHHFLDDQTS